MFYSIIILIITVVNYVASEEPMCSCIEAQKDDDTSTLQSVHIINRYAIRGPPSTYPLDPNINNTATRYPNGRAQLTDAGIEQAYNVGRFYRKRYGKFVRDKQNQSVLRSSSANRVSDLVAIVAKTLWPPQEYEKKWWPPMIYSLPKQLDIFHKEVYCPSADAEEENILKSPEVAEYEKDFKIQALYQYIANNTGLPPNMRSITKVFDCVRSEKLSGLDSPAWATPEIYDQMGDVLSKRLSFVHSTKKSQRLRAGPLLKSVKANIESVINAKPGDKIKNFFIYGTHHYKIPAILSAIGEPQPVYPPLAAAIIFEVHKIEDKYIVRALYLNQTNNWPYTAIKLKLPNCLKAGSVMDMIGGPKLNLSRLAVLTDTITIHDISKIPGITKDKVEKHKECTYKNFVSSIADLTSVDWKTECGIDCSYDTYKIAEENIGIS